MYFVVFKRAGKKRTRGEGRGDASVSRSVFCCPGSGSADDEGPRGTIGENRRYLRKRRFVTRAPLLLADGDGGVLLWCLGQWPACILDGLELGSWILPFSGAAGGSLLVCRREIRRRRGERAVPAAPTISC